MTDKLPKIGSTLFFKGNTLKLNNILLFIIGLCIGSLTVLTNVKENYTVLALLVAILVCSAGLSIMVDEKK